MMKPDTQIETDAVDYFIDENLSVDQQEYLMDVLAQDDMLSDIMDTILLKVSEQDPEGVVSGEGTGTSDSIPARLSNGEFVFTAKAVEVIGADVLQQMMEEAEAQASPVTDEVPEELAVPE